MKKNRSKSWMEQSRPLLLINDDILWLILTRVKSHILACIVIILINWAFRDCCYLSISRWYTYACQQNFIDPSNDLNWKVTDEVISTIRSTILWQLFVLTQKLQTTWSTYSLFVRTVDSGWSTYRLTLSITRWGCIFILLCQRSLQYFYDERTSGMGSLDVKIA